MPISTVHSLKIAGPAGAGIKSSGLLLSKILIAHGLNVRDYSEYPSLVRGGHNTYQLSFSSDEIFTIHQSLDIFFSLVPGHWQQHQSEFTQKTLVFGDDAPQVLPLKELTSQLGSSLYANSICLGVAAFLLGLDLSLCRQLVAQQFGTSSPNNSAFDLGYDYAATNFSQLKIKDFELIKKSLKQPLIFDGRNLFDPARMREKGFVYKGIGR